MRHTLILVLIFAAPLTALHAADEAKIRLVEIRSGEVSFVSWLDNSVV